MTNTQFQVPVTSQEAWEIGQVRNYPYSPTGSNSLTPENDDSARADGSAFAGRYMPPTMSAGSVKAGPTFEVDIPSTLVAPPGAPSVTAVSASGGAAVSSGGTMSGGTHIAMVVVALSGTSAVSGNVVEIFNGGTIVGSGLGAPYTLVGSDISNGSASAFTGVLSSGGTLYTLTPRLAVSSGGNVGPAAVNPWPITVS